MSYCYQNNALHGTVNFEPYPNISPMYYHDGCKISRKQFLAKLRRTAEVISEVCGLNEKALGMIVSEYAEVLGSNRRGLAALRRKLPE